MANTNTKSIKLTGVKSFSHPEFKLRGSSDLTHVKKGDVIRVDAPLADYLLQREQKVGPEDFRPTWVETTEKHTYDFASAPVAAASVDTSDDAGDAGGAAPVAQDTGKETGKTASAGQRTRTTRTASK